MNKTYYKPCSKCHDDECVFTGSSDTHDLCEDYTAWIPIEKEKPQNNQEVLICLSSGMFQLDFFIDGEFETFGYLDIAAWMPLPQPYKGESEDKE